MSLRILNIPRTETILAFGVLLGARRPKWRVAQPKGVKPVRLLAAGKLLETEA